MLQYNTTSTSLPMPEYGRNIQQMVNHCLLIDDRSERNQCAQSIVDTICRLHPAERTNPEWRRRLWDHLAIMSNFQLDIDWPEPLTVSAEDMHSRPAKLPLPGHFITKRVYGYFIDDMIALALSMEHEDPERIKLELLIAVKMKRLLTAANPDTASDQRVFRDLAELSHGEILMTPEEVSLPDFDPADVACDAFATGKKRKKRRH